MKLFGYECYKLIKNRYFLFVMLAALLSACAVFYQTCVNEPMRVDRDLYHQLLTEYQTIPPEQAHEQLLQRQTDLASVNRIRYQEQNEDPALVKQMHNAQLEFFPEQKPYDQLKAEYAAYFADAVLLEQENIVIAELVMQYASMLSYPEYIDGMEERAAVSLSGSIFSNENTFAYRDIQKSLSDFSVLKGEYYPLNLQRGILAFSQDSLSDWILLFLILMCAVLLFSAEWENGLIGLLSATRRGGASLLGAKLSVLCGVACVANTVIRCGNLLIAEVVLGLGDLSRPIQSISAFRSCCYDITLGGYLIVSFLMKLSALLFVCMLSAFVLLSFRNMKLSAAVMFGFFAAEYVTYQTIQPQSVYNPIKYVNLFALLDTHGRFSVYQNLNFFGYPVSTFSLLLPIGLMLIPVGAVGSFWLHHSKRYIRLPKIRCFTKRVGRIRGSSNLFAQENLKFWIRNKGILFLTLAVVISLGSLETGEIFYTSDENDYMIHARVLEGELTEEKQAYLDEIQLQYDTLSQTMIDLEKQRIDGTLNPDDYDVELLNLTRFSSQKNGFTKAKEQYLQMTALKEQGIDARFVSSVKAEKFFGHSGDILMIGLQVVLLLVLAMAPIFAGEYEGNMISLIRTAPNGQTRLFFAKYGVIWCAYPIFFAVGFAPEWYHWIVRYGMTDLSAPLQSVLRYHTAQTNLSILQFALLWYGAMFVAGWLLLQWMMLLSAFLQSVSNTLICGVAVSGVCFLCALIGGSNFLTGLPASAFLFSKRFAYTADLKMLRILPPVWGLLCIGMLSAHLWKWNRIRR